jgi:hypothetical protein
MATVLAKRHPHWDIVQIARKIQGSSIGRRKGGVLAYTVTAIVRYIRRR